VRQRNQAHSMPVRNIVILCHWHAYCFLHPVD
jgi:hypothetical protein